MFVRLLGNLLVNRMNIPLRRSAYAAHRCPPSKAHRGRFFAPMRQYEFPSWTGGDRGG